VAEELSGLCDPEALLQRVRRVGVSVSVGDHPLRWGSFRRSWRKRQRMAFRVQGLPRLVRTSGPSGWRPVSFRVNSTIAGVR
jgi:hypothetical protein